MYALHSFLSICWEGLLLCGLVVLGSLGEIAARELFASTRSGWAARLSTAQRRRIRQGLIQFLLIMAVAFAIFAFIALKALTAR